VEVGVVGWGGMVGWRGVEGFGGCGGWGCLKGDLGCLMRDSET